MRFSTLYAGQMRTDWVIMFLWGYGRRGLSLIVFYNSRWNHDMTRASCLRCSSAIGHDDAQVTLEGKRYHQACGALELWEWFQGNLRHKVKQTRIAMEQRLGKFDDVRHPPLPAELHPAHMCEAKLIHGAGSHIGPSTPAVLDRWYNQQGSEEALPFISCVGWNIGRTMRNLSGMLQATTVTFDNLVHSLADQTKPSDPIMQLWHYALEGGMGLEIGQYAAHCCSLALKTLYAIRNTDATKDVFKDAIGHDLSTAWDMLEGEKGILISILRGIPLFNQGKIGESTNVKSELAGIAHYDDLRWYELSRFEKVVIPEAHLQLAWAAYLRCKELTDYQSEPSHQTDTKISENIPSSMGQKPVPMPGIWQDRDFRNLMSHLDKKPTDRPDWLRLAWSVRGLDGYNRETLVKTAYGLIHSPTGSYVFGSTFQILLLWTQERVSSPRDNPDQYETGLGDLGFLTHSLFGRLEVITANYAHTSGILTVRDINGKPMRHHFRGQMLMHTQSAVFACELTMKWLCALIYPDRPLSHYLTHDVQKLWRRLHAHHSKILDVFHAMPLFQSDGPIEEREHVTADQVNEMLARFRTTYVDARYGITDPHKEDVLIDIDYRITLHLAWAVFLYGYENALKGGFASASR